MPTDQPEPSTRYAVYFVPAAESALYRFGSSVLGYDCYTGNDLPPREEFASDAALWRELSAEPRRYGFHATLKAPFRLAPSRTEAELIGAFASLASLDPAIGRISPEVSLISGFVAIVPRQRCAAVAALADRCTTALDAFRAPMSARERGRRVAGGLSERQMRYLERWGYPYVLEDFRFHMTLTGRLAGERASAVLAQLRSSFAAACGEQELAIDRLALLRQEGEQAPFRVLCQAALSGGG